MIRFIGFIVLFVSICLLTGCESISFYGIKEDIQTLRKHGLPLVDDYTLKQQGKYIYVTHPNIQSTLGYDYGKPAIIIKFKTRF